MADEAAPQSNPFLRAIALGSARLYGRRALLSATAVVFLGFLLLRTLSWSEALIGYAVILLVALLAPRSAETASLPAASAAGSDLAEGGDEPLRRHAHRSLPDPRWPRRCRASQSACGAAVPLDAGGGTPHLLDAAAADRLRARCCDADRGVAERRAPPDGAVRDLASGDDRAAPGRRRATWS